MTTRTVQLLHIEDDVVQQRLVAHHLKAVPEFQFDIRYAEDEPSAIDAFARGGVECVILDYQLRQGNGLNCVRELRRRDTVVPIIAVSGMATPQIASELLEAGADDYIEKQDLNSAVLRQRVCDTLIRASACRQWVAAQRGDVHRRGEADVPTASESPSDSSAAPGHTP